MEPLMMDRRGMLQRLGTAGLSFLLPGMSHGEIGRAHV